MTNTRTSCDDEVIVTNTRTSCNEEVMWRSRDEHKDIM